MTIGSTCTAGEKMEHRVRRVRAYPPMDLAWWHSKMCCHCLQCSRLLNLWHPSFCLEQTVEIHWIKPWHRQALLHEKIHSSSSVSAEAMKNVKWWLLPNNHTDSPNDKALNSPHPRCNVSSVQGAERTLSIQFPALSVGPGSVGQNIYTWWRNAENASFYQS